MINWMYVCAIFILISIAIQTIRIRKKLELKTIEIIISSLYFSMLLGFTILSRTPFSINNTKYTFLYTFINLKNEFSIYGILEIVFNILLFIPCGFILYHWNKSKWQVVLYTGIVSLLIEYMQLILGLGTFEICDLINNTLGGLIGVDILKGINYLMRKIRCKNKE